MKKLFALSAISMVAPLWAPVAQAATVSFYDGQEHTFENQTLDTYFLLSKDGTKLILNNVVLDGVRAGVTAYDGASVELNDITINCTNTTQGSCGGLRIQGHDWSASGPAKPLGYATGSDVAINAEVGIYASGESLIDLNRVTINSINNGVDVNGSLGLSTVNLNNFVINSGRYGLYAMFGAKVDLANGSVNTTNNDAHGIYLGGNNPNTGYQSTVTLSNVDVHTTGDKAYGVYSVQMGQPGVSGGRSEWNQSRILTEGSQSYGVFANFAGNFVDLKNNSSVTTLGDDSFAVFTRGGAKVTLDHSLAETRGTNSIGVYSWYFGNTQVSNGSSVVTRGDNSAGVQVQYAGTLSLADSAVNTYGAGSHGINSVSASAPNGGNQYGSTVNLTNTSVNSAQGYGIQARGGVVNINVNNSSIIGGSGLLNVLEYTGTDPNNFVQEPTTVNLVADQQSYLSGQVTTQANTTSNVTLQGNSVWQLRDDSNVTNLTLSNSTVQFSSPATFSTLRIDGNYTGDNGTIILNTALNDDNSSTDKLIIGGDVAGQTNIRVLNRGGLGMPTQEGIQIIEVAGQSPNDAFKLESDYITTDGKPAVVAGAYSYSLYQGGTTTPQDGNWYLRSMIAENPLTPDVVTPRYQPGAPLYESYAGVLHSLNELPSLRQRVGIRQNADELSDVDSQYGLWVRTDGGYQHVEPGRSTTSADYDINSWRMQLGTNMLVNQTQQGDLVAEASVHYEQANADVGSIFGDGKIDSKGYGVGAALTWYGNNGFYTDVQAKYTWFDSKLSSRTLGVTEVSGNDGHGLALGVEVGNSFRVNDAWSFTPQAQIMYSNVDYDDFYDTFATPVSLKSSDAITGRLGLSSDYRRSWNESANNTKVMDAYGIVNLYQSFSGSNKTDVAGVEFEQRNARTWAGVGAGVSYSWGGGLYSIYARAEGRTSLQNFGDSYGISGSFGVNLKF